MIEGADTAVEQRWMDGWFEDTEKRLDICYARVERHLKPPFPPAVEKLNARLDFMEKLVGLCVGAICALWLTLLFLLLRH